jgi:hypothetical protein
MAVGNRVAESPTVGIDGACWMRGRGRRVDCDYLWGRRGPNVNRCALCRPDCHPSIRCHRDLSIVPGIKQKISCK